MNGMRKEIKKQKTKKLTRMHDQTHDTSDMGASYDERLWPTSFLVAARCNDKLKFKQVLHIWCYITPNMEISKTTLTLEITASCLPVVK